MDLAIFLMVIMVPKWSGSCHFCRHKSMQTFIVVIPLLSSPCPWRVWDVAYFCLNSAIRLVLTKHSIIKPSVTVLKSLENTFCFPQQTAHVLFWNIIPQLSPSSLLSWKFHPPLPSTAEFSASEAACLAEYSQQLRARFLPRESSPLQLTVAVT